MKKYILFTLALLFTSSIAWAQYTNVRIDSGSSSPNEPCIWINPKNPNQVVGGANISSYYWSTNGGSNWSKGNLTSTYSVWGDPSVLTDTNGHFYYFHLTNPSGGYFIDKIISQKSTNGGANWSNGSVVGYVPPKQQDKEWGCLDPRNNNIYVTWTQFDNYGSANSADSSNILFARTTDAGATWSTPLRINQKAGDCIDEDNTVEGAVPSVGPNGEIYVAWSGPLGIVMDKSTNGGLNWLANDIFVTTHPGGWDYSVPGIYRANGLPVTACDLSNGPNRGTIYINWTDQRNGTTDTDVWLIKSTNGGANWSTVKRVNDDPAGKQQFFTWMTIDQKTGYLYFVFYDRRNYTNTQTDVYMARSTDGGETFTNFKVSSSPFTPSSGVFFGDYTNVSAYNGKVRPIWARLNGSSSSAMSIYTALVDFPTNITPITGVVDNYSLEQNYPNPFNPETKIKFSIPEKQNVSLQVYDIQGKLVAEILNGSELSAGNYEVSFNSASSQLSSGTYYYTLKTDKFTQTKKMTIVK